MKRPLLSTLSPAAAVVVGVFLARGAQATTQITFGGFTENNINISDIPGYGSNVSGPSLDYIVTLGGTPNIALTWGPGFQTYTGWDGRGEVAQLDFNLAGTIELLFTPTAGAGVLIDSFVMDEWAGGGDQIVAWEVLSGSGSIASGNWQRSSGGQDIILTGLTTSDAQLGEAVTLRFTQSSGFPSYVALDNLTFAQVPEPSTVALGLLGAGLGALAMRRRK